MERAFGILFVLAVSTSLARLTYLVPIALWAATIIVYLIASRRERTPE